MDVSSLIPSKAKLITKPITFSFAGKKGAYMASVVAGQIPEISNFMGDFWKFVKKYWDFEERDEYWEDLAREGTELSNKYGGDRYAKNLILAYSVYLEKMWEEKHKNE